MPRKVFYSFHFQTDNWRAAQIRNIRTIEGNQVASDNDWESIARQGNDAIQRWIDNQLHGCSCTVVLIGAQTAMRKWIDYEISKSWNSGKGLLGIHINKLQDRNQQTSIQGKNPFSHFKMERDQSSLAEIVDVYDPHYTSSQDVYRYIADNLANWIEIAIKKRDNY